MRIQSFKPAILIVSSLIGLFWVGAGVQTWMASAGSAGEAFTRLPSSYDSGKPLMQLADDAQGKPLLVEFYTDTCVRCAKLVPMVHTLAQSAAAEQCFSLALVNAEVADNKLFVDLFAVKEVPALFVFNLKKMKKTAVVLPNATQPVPTASAVVNAINTAFKINTGVDCSAGV
jgi:thiol-disulfide isomerase/thioredoxin